MAKLQDILGLAEFEVKVAAGSPQDWMRYLDTTSRLYRYPFSDTLLIHAQRRDVTACAELEIGKQVVSVIFLQILRKGGNKSRSHLCLIYNFMTDQTPEEYTEFVRREYGQGGIGLVIGGKEYSVWYNELGMQIAVGHTVNDRILDKAFLSWEEVSGRIHQLLRQGEYAPQVVLDAARENAVQEHAQMLAFLHEDMAEGVAEIVFGGNEAYDFKYGYLDKTEQIAKLIVQPDVLADLTERLEGLAEALILTDGSGRRICFCRCLPELGEFPGVDCGRCCIFAGIMIREPRTLWSGRVFFLMMICLAVSLLFALYRCSDWLASHDVLIGVLVILFILTVFCVLAFPGILILMFFIEGIKVIRHEGMKPSNLLSMLFSILLCAYLVVWPMIGGLGKNTLSTIVYVIISFSAVYILSLMAMYSLSAVLNLIHLKKKRNADYIVVLGAGIIGKKVTPLLAARIERGIELLHCNPNALLIMSGGQGHREDITESESMAAYAVDRGVDAKRIILEQKSVSTEENLMYSRKLMEKQVPKIVIVTTAYHVFRALILAKQQGIKCVGFGAKTKWYFTLNALLREFVGYLSLSWKKHALVIGIVVCVVVLIHAIR